MPEEMRWMHCFTHRRDVPIHKGFNIQKMRETGTYEMEAA
jgi:hypothetical protein